MNACLSATLPAWQYSIIILLRQACSTFYICFILTSSYVRVSMQHSLEEQLKSQTLSTDSYPQHQWSRRIHHPVDSQVPSTWWAVAPQHPLSLAESSSWSKCPRRAHSLPPWLHHWSQSWGKGKTPLLPEWTFLFVPSKRRARTWSSTMSSDPCLCTRHYCLSICIINIRILAHTLYFHYTSAAVIWS